MAEDINDKEDKFDFTADGEALGYISLAQARLLAMQTARETPGEYGGRFRDSSMAFEITESSEDEDYYIVTLGVRPQGDFSGTTGQEQFFISKEGEVAHRQVLSLPRTGSSSGRMVSIVAGVTVSVVVIAAVIAFAIVGNGSANSPATPTPTPTSIVVVVPPPTGTPTPAPTQIPTPEEPTPTPLPTLVPLSTYTPFPTGTPRPTFTPFPTPLALPTYTLLPTLTPFPTSKALPTYTPLPTATPRPTFTPQPTYTLFPTRTVMPPATPILRRIIATTTPITRSAPTPIPTATPAAFTPENYHGYIPLLDAYVSDIGFFESPLDLRPESERVYADKFDQASARYIAWELHFDFPNPAYRTEFEIDAIYYREDGSEFSRHSANMYVEPWWDTAFRSSGWGWTDPGIWERGIFRVDLSVEGTLVAIGEFQVR